MSRPDGMTQGAESRLFTVASQTSEERGDTMYVQFGYCARIKKVQYVTICPPYCHVTYRGTYILKHIQRRRYLIKNWMNTR